MGEHVFRREARMRPDGLQRLLAGKAADFRQLSGC